MTAMKTVKHSLGLMLCAVAMAAGCGDDVNPVSDDSSSGETAGTTGTSSESDDTGSTSSSTSATSAESSSTAAADTTGTEDDTTGSPGTEGDTTGSPGTEGDTTGSPGTEGDTTGSPGTEGDASGSSGPEGEGDVSGSAGSEDESAGSTSSESGTEPDASGSDAGSTSAVDGSSDGGGSAGESSTGGPDASSSSGGEESSESTGEEVLPPPDDLVPNGGFEDGTRSQWTQSGGPTFTVTTDEQHTGMYSLLTTNRVNGYDSPAYNLIPLVTPGDTYNISVSVRLLNGEPANFGAQVVLNCGSGNSYPWLGGGSVTATGWTQLGGEYTVPDCELTRLEFYINASAGVSYYLDDLVLSQP